MPLEALKPRYLSYLNGEARDDLNRPFDDSGESIPSVTAFREHLQSLIDLYLASDVAGKSAAELVGELPYDGSFGYRDALIGLHILRETKAALDSLLDDDETLRAAVRDDGGETDDETDSAVRDAAKEYDLDTRKDELNRIARESAQGYGRTISGNEIAASMGEASSEDIASSALNDDKPKERVEVRLYEDDPTRSKPQSPHANVSEPEKTDEPPAADSAAIAAPADVGADHILSRPANSISPIEPDAAVTEPSKARKPHDEPDCRGAGIPENIGENRSGSGVRPPAGKTDSLMAENPAMALFGEEPSRIKIDHPDFRGAPVDVFRRAKEWLRDHIIAVAVGTRTKDKYPRIAPLIAQTQDPEFTITVEEVRKLIGGIRRRFAMLRFSKGKFDGPDFMGKVSRDSDGGPGDDLLDMMGQMGDLLDGLGDGRRRKNDDGPSFTPWNDEGGGWQGGEGEDWK